MTLAPGRDEVRDNPRKRVGFRDRAHVARAFERGAARAIQELYTFFAEKDARRILAKEGLKVASQ